MTFRTSTASGTKRREGEVRFVFSMSEDAFAAIKEAALKNNRTVGAEIRSRVEKSLEGAE